MHIYIFLVEALTLSMALRLRQKPYSNHTTTDYQVSDGAQSTAVEQQLRMGRRSTWISCGSTAAMNNAPSTSLPIYRWRGALLRRIARDERFNSKDPVTLTTCLVFRHVRVPPLMRRRHARRACSTGPPRCTRSLLSRPLRGIRASRGAPAAAADPHLGPWRRSRRPHAARRGRAPRSRRNCGAVCAHRGGARGHGPGGCDARGGACEGLSPKDKVRALTATLGRMD
jgi:hypothetical protein